MENTFYYKFSSNKRFANVIYDPISETIEVQSKSTDFKEELEKWLQEVYEYHVFDEKEKKFMEKVVYPGQSLPYFYFLNYRDLPENCHLEVIVDK